MEKFGSPFCLTSVLTAVTVLRGLNNKVLIFPRGTVKKNIFLLKPISSGFYSKNPQGQAIGLFFDL